MTEVHRRRAILEKLARAHGRASAVIPTGFPALDAALGEGLPRGSIVELFGPPGCGKSSVAARCVAHLQQHGLGAAWIDAEHAFHAAWAAALGADLERLPVLQPDSAEQAMESALRLVASGALDLLVIDSAAALAPRLEIEAGVGEAGPGLHSRVLASGLRRLARAASRAGTTVLFLNQTRARSAAAGGEGETSAGGAPLKLFAAVRVALIPVTESRLRFRIVKNKAGNAFGEGELGGQRGERLAESP
jgi:recombination protein RecA